LDELNPIGRKRNSRAKCQRPTAIIARFRMFDDQHCRILDLMAECQTLAIDGADKSVNLLKVAILHGVFLSRLFQSLLIRKCQEPPTSLID
jgi:hypothetical protein